MAIQILTITITITITIAIIAIIKCIAAFYNIDSTSTAESVNYKIN
jgi:hypothetical protein